MTDPVASLAAAVHALVDERVEQRLAELAANQATAPAPWLDVDGAARHLGYADGQLVRGRRRIYDLVSRGELEPTRDGRRLLFRPADIDAYLTQTEEAA